MVDQIACKDLIFQRYNSNNDNSLKIIIIDSEYPSFLNTRQCFFALTTPYPHTAHH